MATSVVNPRVQFFANNGRPLIGGRIHTYVAGSSTRARTYKDAAKAQPNTNPIILDGRGEAQIYLAEGVEYKFVLEDSKGALIYTQEPVYGAVWPNADDWPSDATLSFKYAMQAEEARDDAYAAAESIGVIHFFDNYEDYSGGLPDGAVVEIANDETRYGARVRYKVLENGSLQYIVTLASESSIRHAIFEVDDDATLAAQAASFPNGGVIRVRGDSSFGGRPAEYRKDAGALALVKVLDCTTPEMFGGRTATAFQTAMVVASYAQVPVVLSSGETYTLDRKVSSRPCVIKCDGVANIVFDDLNGEDGISFDPANIIGAKGGLIGVNLIVRGSNGGTCVSMPKDVSQYNFYHTRWEFRDIYGRGFIRNTDAYSFCWDYGFETWFRLSDCAGLEFEHVVVQGQYDIQQDPATQFHDCAVDIDAAGGILTARIDDVTFGPIHTPFKWGNRAFFSLSNFDFIGAHNGIFMYGAESVFNEPKIGPGNINAQQYGIYLDGPDTIDFNSVTIRRHRQGWKGATWDWHGIYAAGVSDGRIRACTVQPDEGNGEFSGTMHAYTLKDCSLGAFAENFVGPGCDVGVLLDNCTSFNVDNTISAQNKTTDVLFKLTNDTRRMTIGEYALVSSFSGTVVEKDSTITQPVSMRNDMPDHQSTGNITQDWTRTSAAADSKKWRQTISATQRNQQLVDDSGTALSYHLVTRSGATVAAQELRGTDLYLNGGTTRVNAIRPSADNSFACGTTNYRFAQFSAATGTINTSDAREKTEPLPIDDLVLDAWGDVQLVCFQWLDAIRRKGQDLARWHFGVIAQQVRDAFLAHGLDGTRYGLLCYDEWLETPEVLDEDGTVLQAAQSSGNRWGIRADQCLFLEASYQRRELHRLKARISALEQK